MWFFSSANFHLTTYTSCAFALSDAAEVALIHLDPACKTWGFGSHLIGDDLASFMEPKDCGIAVDANQFC